MGCDVVVTLFAVVLGRTRARRRPQEAVERPIRSHAPEPLTLPAAATLNPVADHPPPVLTVPRRGRFGILAIAATLPGNTSLITPKSEGAFRLAMVWNYHTSNRRGPRAPRPLPRRAPKLDGQATSRLGTHEHLLHHTHIGGGHATVTGKGVLGSANQPLRTRSANPLLSAHALPHTRGSSPTAPPRAQCRCGDRLQAPARDSTWPDAA